MEFLSHIVFFVFFIILLFCFNGHVLVIIVIHVDVFLFTVFSG